MAEPFKNFIDAGVVRSIAEQLRRAAPAVDAQGFEARALAGLDGLELKARVLQLAEALVAAIQATGADAHTACTWLEAMLGPPGREDSDGDDLGSLRPSEAGLAGWPVWPLTEAVARLALPGHAERGLAALQAMTQRFSAEFAIRHFIVAQPGLALATLARWTTHPSAHVRRLVSEGSRPRLPWGLRLQALVADPSPTLPLLRALQDDASAYVRRSVANHLNDIAKDHPALVAAWLAEHLPEASENRRALLKHASRSLIKAGDAAVLAAWGQGAAFKGTARLVLSAPVVMVGESLGLEVTLANPSRQRQPLVIDYAVHHAKAAGHTTAKVFKGWVLDLAPGETRTLSKRHSFRPVTVRRYHAGAHGLDLRINGRVVAEAGFELRLPD
ncbi:MAG: DNA alkylation repair protein [Burkholderiaceae bacterium]|nr:DNA alkylation repair protein [Burkholderiaceae bacterium]